jgi:MFS family permease
VTTSLRRFPIILAGFTAFLDLYSTQPILPVLMSTFGASHFAVSLTVTASTIAVAMFAPVVGRVADLVGRKRVIVGSAFALAAATALSATASTLPQFITWRFVQGMVTPGVFAITIAYIHEEWPETHAARGTSAYMSGAVLGGFCGRAVVAVVAASFGWKASFVVLSLINLAAAAAISMWMPKERERLRALDRRHGQSVRRLLANAQLIATNAVGFCVLFVQVAVFTYVAFYLSAPPFSLSTAALGWLFTVFLLGAIATPIAGHYVDLRGHRAGMLLGMSIGVAGALATLTPWLPVIVIGLGMVGTGVFVGQATASSYIGAVTEEDRGLAVGIYSTWYYIGGSVGGALPAALWNLGGWLACILMVLGVQIATAVISWTLWRDVRRHTDIIVPSS